ncbi:hypothetical protein RCO28_23610 [Streptomyces sp. LHD-70]|uniref:hypothetical protein n=1 Tax=Streptomyces sp. LHD-70 TaxID=3072140 RepID=UPI0028108811|nr:hypothetical protein [Streptomyces sp. LHD-70]MDQ8705460.1 hypothetical protein [Streptomyces sp. LHD-70]
MAESVPVRCPACRREHVYAAPVFPCACGAPVRPPLVRGAAPVRITHRTWSDEWVSVRCLSCGRQDQWPHPELGCPCGTILRIIVRSVATGACEGSPQAAPPLHIPLPPTAPAPRPAFHPVTIRTARDAVTAAALYLKWLGYRDVRHVEPHNGAAVGLHAPGLVARVEPSTRRTTVRDVETLWLSALAESVVPVHFSLAGYTEEARFRADTLAVPLFVLDFTGTPQPVNSPADELVTTGGGG